MKAIRYTLHTLEPVLVSQAQSGEENSAIGMSYLPGSVIRGALAARYLQGYEGQDEATDDAFRALFLDGTVCYLYAYAAPRGERLLPRPRSWLTEKDQANDPTAPVYDLAVDPGIRLEQPKALDVGDYVQFSMPEPADEDDEGAPFRFEPLPPTVAFFSPGRQNDVRISLEQVNTRTDENAVYRYDALAAGERLAGAIVAEEEAHLAPLAELLQAGTELYLGRARTAGYGRVQVETVSEAGPWQEYEPQDAESGGRVVVTLLSDTVLRNVWGQNDADLDSALARLLGLEALEAERSFCQVRLVGGFNHKWGLPLPQSWALAAGSVYVYPTGQVDPVRLRALTAHGLGERRAEGFGRIAVNWHVWPELQQEPLHQSDRLPPRLSEASRQIAARMARRRLELALERGLVAAVADARIRPTQSNAQLSRIRQAAQRALHDKELSALARHLGALKRDAIDQLDRARVNGVHMLDWIRERVDQQDAGALLLQRGGPALRVAGVEAELGPELRAVFTARLIDGVMNKAVRQNQAPVRQNQESAT